MAIRPFPIAQGAGFCYARNRNWKGGPPMPRRYRIYLLSAKSILSYAKEEGGAVTIALNRDATRRCVVSGR